MSREAGALAGLTIGVVFGGANSEHDVSVASARGVIPALRGLGARVRPLAIDRSGVWRSPSTPAAGANPTVAGPTERHLSGLDLVFPLVHGRGGEDGTLQGALELARVPYVGCGVLASALAMDKNATFRMLRGAGFPVVDTTSVAGLSALPAISAAVTYPVFVKPNRAGSSVGASRVDHPDDLPGAVATALNEDSSALIQPVAAGEEVSIGVLQTHDGVLHASGPSRLVLGSGDTFFSFDGKYSGGDTHLQIPGILPAPVVEELQRLAIAAFRELQCVGLARVDFFVDHPARDPAIVINEINTMPGFGPRSHYPRLWDAAGIGYEELLTELVLGALDPAAAARR